jgi:ATP-binding cassette subfamily B protein
MREWLRNIEAMPKRISTIGILSGSARLGRTFWPEIKTQRWRLLLSIGIVCAAIVFQVLEPWPLKFIYDHIFRVQRGGMNLRLLGNLSSGAVLGWSVIAIVVIAGLGALTEYAGMAVLNMAAARILAGIRARLFLHLIHLPVAFHERHRTGDLITRVTFDIDRLRDVLVTAVLPFVTTLFTLLAMLSVMFWMNWQLALLATTAFPLFALSVRCMTARIREATRTQRAREGAIAATTGEAMGSIRVVQAFSLQDFFFRTFSTANRTSLHEGAKAQQLTAGLERTAQLLIASSTAIVLWSGAHLVLDHRLTPGDLIVFVSYLRSAFRPIRQLAKYVGQMAKALASGDRVLNLLHTQSEIRDRADAVDVERMKGRICFENVSFAYEPGRLVLRNLCFEVTPGQRIAIVGPSGSGKSTLVSLLLRFHDVTEGRIVIDGRDIRDYKLAALRNHITMVPQDSVLFVASVRENIALGAPGAGMDKVVKAACQANAHDFILDLPEQYETVVGERGATLSGGQRQRIAIARAAVRDAGIVILDEPASGLDQRNELEVSGALERLTQGRTTFLISHNLAAAQNAGLILYLEDGEIVERGTHAQLMARNGRYAAMYKSQPAAEFNHEGLYASIG